MLKGKNILLGVTGGIAAYKMADVASLLTKLHADVHVVMTENATKFIPAETFQVLTKNKVYVDVLAEFSKDGLLIPKEITWEDGRKYEITRVKDKRRAASTRAGGVGERYTCVVDGKEIFLFYEDNNMWFMERAGA